MVVQGGTDSPNHFQIGAGKSQTAARKPGPEGSPVHPDRRKTAKSHLEKRFAGKQAVVYGRTGRTRKVEISAATVEHRALRCPRYSGQVDTPPGGVPFSR